MGEFDFLGDFSGDSGGFDTSGYDFSMPSMDYSLPDTMNYSMPGPLDSGSGGGNPLGNMSWGQMLGGGLGLGTAGLGIAGVLQQMLGSQQQPMTAQQRASMNQGLQSMGTAQGAGASLLGAMQGLQPMQMQAAGQGYQGQMGLLNQFQPWMSALAQGNLPLSPQIQSLVDQAYAPSFGSAFQQASQAGQARGFYDNPATGPVGGNVLGQMLPQLAGQEAQAKLNLGTQMPGVIGQAVNNYSPLTQAFGQASQGQGNIMNALSGASAVAPLAGMATKPQNPSMLQSFNQMGPVLGGVGGLLTGISALSGMGQQRPQY